MILTAGPLFFQTVINSLFANLYRTVCVLQELLEKMDLATVSAARARASLRISKEDLKDALAESVCEDDCIDDWAPEDLLKQVS